MEAHHCDSKSIIKILKFKKNEVFLENILLCSFPAPPTKGGNDRKTQ
jgi:hypothetical protein